MDDLNEMVSFSDVLHALSDTTAPFPARFLRNFSDLSRKNLKELMVIWPHLPEARKISLLEDIELTLCMASLSADNGIRYPGEL